MYVHIHMIPDVRMSGNLISEDRTETIQSADAAVSAENIVSTKSGNYTPKEYAVNLRKVALSSRFHISLFMKQFMIAGIRFYQRYLSPLKTTKCPYIPSCSAYGLEAIQKYGAWKGGWMALWRILRCNPFSHGGYDPVP